ncbi:glutathione S-transferase family protein [Aquamicrobium sp. LC103]|uniref:glutathione S-transferase family protein n=1 Tax=Aquamicrobium sp. LC103 TaxID=1120658 RepID=UPI00063E9106|nr:glutathione S-transferase family protein [Aquamicrobium sp. LC103]TKT69529.1 glutathione S-transferase family protein [Aquamicrobium sp. LC103]
MLKVYGRSNSSNSAKIYWLLDEIGQVFEQIECGGRFGGTDTLAYRAMNPHGKVPTVVDGDVIVWESNAVLRYLAGRFGAAALWPTEVGARACVDMWMDWSATGLVPPLGRLRKSIKGAEIQETLVAPVIATFRLLDAQLQNRDYIAGNAFTLADIAAGPALHRWFLLAVDKPDLRALGLYRDRLAARAPYQARVVNGLT